LKALTKKTSSSIVVTPSAARSSTLTSPFALNHQNSSSQRSFSISLKKNLFKKSLLPTKKNESFSLTTRANPSSTSLDLMKQDGSVESHSNEVKTFKWEDPFAYFQKKEDAEVMKVVNKYIQTEKMNSSTVIKNIFN